MKALNLLVLSGFLVALSGCDLFGGGSGGEEISGRLVDGRGEPVVGAMVWVYPESAAVPSESPSAAAPESTVTDSSGRFRFRNLPGERYNLAASIARNDSTLALFLPGLRARGRLRLPTDTLRPTGALSLRLFDEAGYQAVDARCTIQASPWSAPSDIQGACAIEGLPPGTYVVAAASPGLSAESDPVVVMPESTTLAGNLTLSSPVSEWLVPGAPGYTYRIPASLGISEASGDAEPAASWFARYDGPPVSLLVGLDVVSLEAFPETYPGYVKDTAFEDAAVRAERLSYRIPAFSVGETEVFVEVLTLVDKVSGSPLLHFKATAHDPGQRAIAVKILNSVETWAGPGDPPPTPPLPPALLSPALGEQDVPLAAALSWEAMNGAESYDVQVATDPGFSSPVFEDSLIAGDSIRTDSLLVGETYYWRARVRKPPFVSRWSWEGSFTTRGLAWTTRPLPVTTDTMTGAAWNGSLYLVTSAPMNFFTSPTGATWNWSASANGSRNYGVQWWNEAFVAHSNLGVLDVTTNGTLIDGYVVAAQQPLFAAANNGTLMAFGTTAGRIYTGTGFAAWTLRDLGVNAQVNALTWSGSLFVAALSNGMIFTSPDGVAWTQRNSGTTRALYGLASGSRGIVAVGAQGTVLRSQDGISWFAETSGTTRTLRAVGADGATYIAAGDEGTFAYSHRDGAWMPLTVPLLPGQLRFVQRLGNRWIAGGTNGLLMTAP